MTGGRTSCGPLDRQRTALPIYREQPDDPDSENTLATAVFRVDMDRIAAKSTTGRMPHALSLRGKAVAARLRFTMAPPTDPPASARPARSRNCATDAQGSGARKSTWLSAARRSTCWHAWSIRPNRRRCAAYQSSPNGPGRNASTLTRACQAARLCRLQRFPERLPPGDRR